jgi:outer membrane receptor protein involved in Fe transport
MAALRIGVILPALLLGASRAVAADQPPPPSSPPSSAPSPPLLPAPSATETIVVTAKRLNDARSRIQPSLGATVTNFTPQALARIPQGANAELSTVLLQAPGVAEDSYGQLHVRGDHNEVQYRLDGVELPEGLAVFGQALESRFAHAISFITGALPAQYGVLQAAVVDIVTKSGATDPGGEISVYGGARDYFQPSFSYGAAAGKWDWFATGDLFHDRVGIENPTDGFNAVHDLTNQYHGLAHLDYTASADTRISLLAGVSNAQFQIPNNPGQVPALGLSVDGIDTADSADLTEHQREITDFTILSLQQHFDGFDVQTSLFSRYSSLYFSPDPVADLLFSGIAQTAARSVWSSGVQSDASWYVSDAHTLRAGVQVTAERTVSHTVSDVLALDGDGAQISATPETLTDATGKTGAQYGIYLQDEWKLRPGLTLNYGARFDLVDEFTHENQVSPRVNIVWQPLPGTALHAGYSHYFTPPPFELVGGDTIALFAHTTAAAAVAQDSLVRAEHDNYFDVGGEQVVARGLRLGLDGYYKSARQLIDEGQFGAPIILSAFNYASGQVDGLEGSASYDRGPLSTYANLAYSRAIARDIDTAQFNFQPDELAYTAHHYIHLDHDQRWTSSAGAAYSLLSGTDYPAKVSADLQVGSGLRTSTALVPNGRALPGYYVINLSSSQALPTGMGRGLHVRFDVLNLLDRRYEIRDGAGVGVGAPQFGLRRTLLAGITQSF